MKFRLLNVMKHNLNISGLGHGFEIFQQVIMTLGVLLFLSNSNQIIMFKHRLGDHTLTSIRRFTIYPKLDCYDPTPR